MRNFEKWSEWIAANPTGTETVAAAIIVAVLVVRPALHRTRVGRRLDSALTLIILGLACASIAALGEGTPRGVFLWSYAVAMAAIGIGIVRAVLVLFVDFHLRERRGAGVSAIVRDVGSVLVYFFIVLLVLRFVLDVNLASLVATSAVLTAIIGLAFQDVLGSVISGLVLELEDPFRPRDWVRVGTFEGCVVETGWRTTKIRTRVNEVVTLPNTYLAREPVVNFSRPDPIYGDTLHLDVAYESPPHAVKRALLDICAAEPAVLPTPEPEVRTFSYHDSGIQYAVRYWLNDYAELERVRDRLMSGFWYALGRADIRIPFPARDVYVHSEAPSPSIAAGDKGATLSRTPLLQPLSEDEIRILAERARRLVFGRGEAIVHEGERGSSFYVVERGALSVRIGTRNGSPDQVIARLEPGDFFGEMSLLAGDARSATIVAEDDTAVLEVEQAAFQQIVAANPQVLEPISQIAARRLAAQQEHRQQEALPSSQEDAAAQPLLQRIRSFFGV